MSKIKKYLLVLSLFGLFSASVGQLVQIGRCDENYELEEDFNIEEFLGVWYEISRTDSPSSNGDCASFNFVSTENTINVNHYAVNNNFLEEAQGTASLVANTARLSLSISSFENPIDFWILMTDHSNFAVAFSCENISDLQRRIHLWILGRERTFTNEMIPALINIQINNVFGIDSSTLRSIDHNDDACYVLPIIEPGQPIVLPGRCDPNIPVVQQFDVAAFTGVWHQMSSYHSENAAGTCARAQYTLDGGVVNVVNSQVVNQALDSITGTAIVSSDDNSAKLSVTLNVAPGVPVEQDLWILATDYNNYAVSYTCVNLPDNQKRVFSWILSRARAGLSDASQTEVDQLVSSIVDLNAQYYVETDQSNTGCFYYPDPVANQPVVFGGQCDETIPAMPGFDAVAYMGLWHNIELYPQAFQEGTCSNARYTLVDGIVEVFNTQVVNQRLDTIDGSAVVVSDDGTAKLEVTFPIVGTEITITSNYWVLDTDYSSYALVYSCTNRNDYEMQVSSWKLSRTKELPIAANNAINAVMATIPVLDTRYFEISDQSPGGCFYIPEAQPGVPVVFPGQCDDSITAHPAIDMQLFSGIWHEIEAYPKEEQSGHCINHQFTFVSNTQLNLVSSSIDDQFLTVSNGVVSVVSNDGSGRLTIVITVDGQPITIPYWILSTDYTSYALAYSCVNIGTDFRGIWSWKLSRNKQLSDADATEIANAIANIEVLDNVYYEDVDQSDDACFYLPDLNPGEPVILNGQCDGSILGIAGLDLSRYSGRWRLIESYGADFQVGTCNIADYTFVSATTLNVEFSQVLNQGLLTESASGTLISNNGRLIFTFPSTGTSYDVTVLDTDYDSYALVYHCANINSEQRRVYSWKLSRGDTLSQIAIDNMNRIIDDTQVLNNRYYYTIERSQSACFYFPEPDASTMVRFPGQCDESIPTVQGFEANRYMGLWHDIQSYPMPFQDGSCPNAFYSINNAGNVDVLNTQVIGQRLDSINGLAVVASDDGSAKLRVTFNVQGIEQTSDYWVLATDYETFALVYSCTNLGSDYKTVSSWKLSRTKDLTPEANNQITNAMNSLDILDQRYYVNRDQSAAGCFYYPEYETGVPVIFPGQCDNTISAQPNFQMLLFAGLWYEVQAYPKGEPVEQCFSHQFGLDMSLVSSGVYDQALEVTNANVAFETDDGSGKLVIINTVEGQEMTAQFWILSTDYSNYALGYRCIDLPDDTRLVHSWKLSRTRELSPTANIEINNAIDNVDVLDNMYFEEIQHTDEACFYLPELVADEPVVFPGQCDVNIPVMQGFDASRYLGRWKLIESYPSSFQTGTCNEATYSLNADGSVEVYNTEVVNQALNSETGNAVIATADGSGKLTVTFPNNPVAVDYWILDTDYDTYTLVYSCSNINPEQRMVFSWKMSRTDTLSEQATIAIDQIVNSINVLNQRYYQTVDRSPAACFYFPEPNDNTPVRFRGQCDESIPTVMNFDAARYLGLWHDIQSYPMPFQDGSCPNAFYSLNSDGNVDVFNTQVIGQALDTINGVAVVVSDDGSAKLSVTFNVLGMDMTSNYWVLATDYDSYSLVYSCTNLGDEYKLVSSWKLSRTKTLTPEANNQITNVMNSLDILDQRYYVNRDQSAAGCFYYPEAQSGIPVVFPGQCDNNIAALPGFDMSQFQGLWHEIQAYPKQEQEGQCINHQFSLATANTFNLQSTNVNNLALDVMNGNVAFSSNDGSGRLVITITSNGQQIEIPFWILSTDYTNYALAYACTNLNDDYRGVWSWKLSTTKELSTASNTLINAAMANIDVLDNRYFEDIQQTDEDCFYLPELGPNDPVIFPGQCDLNISVVQNFDAARYLGRWRLIETYASEFQGGTCAEATYSLDEDGSVVVYNTEVVNEELLAQTGRAIVATSDGSGKLSVTFPDNPVAIDYWILDTDYETYTLVYSCANINDDQRRVWSWKMSRTNSLTPAATTAIDNIVDTINVLNDRYYLPVDRSSNGCFYYPTPDDETPVIFPGQCDENIPAFAGFNPIEYAGEWFDVESYPAPFQFGTCNRANYTINEDGSVRVENTQVVNQELETWVGSAVLNSDDGTAKLEVTFVVNGIAVTSDYWVLSTDYTSYSLVYSCRNIDDENREVFSWKLSRQPELPAQAAAQINNIVNSIQVLDQQYFVERQHSEGACFYYPDNNGGDVVLDGVCAPENQIPMVTNFNANAFAGTWHEVARFPSALQNGKCTRSGFTLNADNTYSIVQTDVREEREVDVETIATVAADGRGIITGTIDGAPFDSIYILATDYNEYALAYSCRNLENNQKQIYSWKLSRNQAGLSQAANDIIDNAVSENIDLFENYYDTTGQDVSSCFHYPEYEELPGFIELLGSCDTSIRGVPNFNANAYLGRWFEIERYPQPNQAGQCSRAEYSAGDGNVEVSNSEVLDMILGTQLGTAVVASDDGTGQLDVTFVVNGVTITTNYYVLATDYTNYALVYSCSDLNNGYRQVSSWKLSRERTLSLAALAIMAEVISNTEGLIEDYYQPTSQNDEDCFYIPEVDATQAPLFRGRCEEIPPLIDFEPERYAGWWHEIERYPVDHEIGECISSNYNNFAENSFTVVDTSVSNGVADVASGDAIITEDGRLVKQLMHHSIQDLHILATDYETYSILYSCVNVGEEYRRVWSAKHSKARSLTNAAQQAIAPVIENNIVLYSQFYQAVDQSDAACFHYPAESDGQVILPGQCNTNIPIVQNFDVDAFEGTWYQLQRYSEAGDRQCIGLSYIAETDSEYTDLLYFENVGGELVTAQGLARLSSTDGSARITVAMPVEDDSIVTTVLILDTDYENYAVGYSCTNINVFQRRVGAWILSRSRTLSAEATNSITALVSQTPELHQPYFKEIVQNEDCTDPSSSALIVKSSIILLLVCAMMQLLL